MTTMTIAAAGTFEARFPTHAPGRPGFDSRSALLVIGAGAWVGARCPLVIAVLREVV